MGLAILPARLKDELEELSKCLVEGKDVRAVAELEKHADWVDEFLPRHPELNSENVMDILKEEVGKVFVGVLEDRRRLQVHRGRQKCICKIHGNVVE